jgi:hypothetical protein
MQEVDVETGNYLAGFADGEGCFYVGVHPTKNVSLGLQVIPEFHVSQNGERISVLQLFVEALGCGVIKKNASADSRDKTYVLVVKRHDDLFEKRISEIAFSMNGAKFRKHRLVNLLQNLEPSETICQVPPQEVKI